MQGDRKNSKYLLKILGEIFRREREINTNLSCNKAEEEFDISRGNLNRLENGKTDPSFTTLWKAAEANGQKLSYLINLIENKVGDE